MQLDQLSKNSNVLSGENYSKNFDLSKAKPIRKINELIEIYSHHPVTEFSHKKEELIKRGIPTITLIHDYDLESKEYFYTLKIFSEISLRYRKELFFMISSKYSKITQLFAESFSLQKDEFPALCLTSNLSANKEQSKIDKYRLVSDKNKNEILTKEKIINFIEDWKNMNLPIFFPSEEIPNEIKDEDHIYKFVANNLKKLLKKNENKFILLNICSDRLEICEKFRERLRRISHKLQKNDRVIVGEFNPYLNDIEDHFDARYIPSIFLIPDRGDRLKDAKYYTGRLNTKDIVQWVIEQSDFRNFEENKLPLEDTLIMEEDLVDLKAIDLENKSISRQIYNKLMDPVQKELWKFPTKEDIELENNFYEDFYMRFFRNDDSDNSNNVGSNININSDL